MNSGEFLLRMLEPAVRPDGRSAQVARLAPAAGGQTVPFEQRDFQSLLEEAQDSSAVTAAATAGDLDAERPPSAGSPLAVLAQIDRIENTMLRDMVSRL